MASDPGTRPRCELPLMLTCELRALSETTSRLRSNASAC